MKISRWFLIGIGAFGLIMGYLVGASNTPVVGAVLAILVPAATAFFGLFRGKKESSQPKPALYLETKPIGLMLAFFSIFLLVGLFAGEYHRRFDLFSGVGDDEKQFIWSDSETKPETLDSALLWINTAYELRKSGYSDEEIRELYEMSLPLTTTKPEEEKPSGPAPGTLPWTPYPVIPGIDSGPPALLKLEPSGTVINYSLLENLQAEKVKGKNQQ